MMYEEGGYGTKAGAAKNPWIKHLRAESARRGITYSAALRHPEVRASYTPVMKRVRVARAPVHQIIRPPPLPPGEQKRSAPPPQVDISKVQIQVPSPQGLVAQVISTPSVRALADLVKAWALGAPLDREERTLLDNLSPSEIAALLDELVHRNEISNAQANRVQVELQASIPIPFPAELQEPEYKVPSALPISYLGEAILQAIRNPPLLQAHQLAVIRQQDEPTIRSTLNTLLDDQLITNAQYQEAIRQVSVFFAPKIPSPPPSAQQQGFVPSQEVVLPPQEELKAQLAKQSRKRKAEEPAIEFPGFGLPEEKQVSLRKEFPTLPATVGTVKRKRGGPEFVGKIVRHLTADQLAPLNRLARRLGPQSLAAFEEAGLYVWDQLVPLFGVRGREKISDDQFTRWSRDTSKELQARGVSLTGAGWNRVNKMAEDGGIVTGGWKGKKGTGYRRRFHAAGLSSWTGSSGDAVTMRRWFPV